MSTWDKAIDWPDTYFHFFSNISMYIYSFVVNGIWMFIWEKHPTAVTDVKSSLCQKSGFSIYTVLFLHRCYFLSYLGLKCSLFKMLDMKGWLLLYLGLKAPQHQLLESTVPYKWTFQKQLNGPLWNKIGARLTHFHDSAGFLLVLHCSCNNAFPFKTTITVQTEIPSGEIVLSFCSIFEVILLLK